MSPHRETPTSMIRHRGVILTKTISYIFTSLVACHVMTHQPLDFIMHFTWAREVMTHRGGIYFWKTIPLAHLFLCSATPIQNYFSQFALHTSVTCFETMETRQLISNRTRALQTTTSHTHNCSGPTHVSLFTRLDMMTRALRMTTAFTKTGFALLHVNLLSRLHIMTTQLTSATCPPNDSTSFSNLLWWRI